VTYRILAFSLAATLSALISTLGSETANAAAGIQACPPIASGGGETVEGFIKRSTGPACTVTNSSYIRRFGSYKMDVHATTGGNCTLRHPELNGSCTVDGVQLRGVSGMRVDAVAGPAGPPYAHNIPPTMFPDNGFGQRTYEDQDVDSRIAGSILYNTTPTWYPGYNGQWTLEFKNIIATTNCSIMPNNIVQTWTVHVMDCKPVWWLHGDPVLNLHGPATGPVRI
jgi:hypothetical protein